MEMRTETRYFCLTEQVDSVFTSLLNTPQQHCVAAKRDFLISAEAGLAVAAEMKKPEERTDEEKMALLGKPRLGEVFRAQIRIKESKEFKNTVDKLVQRANASIILGELLVSSYTSTIVTCNMIPIK